MDPQRGFEPAERYLASLRFAPSGTKGSSCPHCIHAQCYLNIHTEPPLPPLFWNLVRTQTGSDHAYGCDFIPCHFFASDSSSRYATTAFDLQTFPGPNIDCGKSLGGYFLTSMPTRNDTSFSLGIVDGYLLSLSFLVWFLPWRSFHFRCFPLSSQEKPVIWRLN